MAKRKTTKKPLTNREKWEAQVKRIHNVVKQGLKRGYVFSPEYAELIPETPKRVTSKALKKIQAIKPTDVYKYSELIDIGTGETIAQGKKLTPKQYERIKDRIIPITEPQHVDWERRERDYYEQVTPQEIARVDEIIGGSDPRYNLYEGLNLYTEATIINLRSELNQFSYNIRDVLNSIIDRSIRAVGAERVAEAVNRFKEDGNELVVHDPSDPKEARNYIARFLTYLPEVGPMEMEELNDYLEELMWLNG